MGKKFIVTFILDEDVLDELFSYTDHRVFPMNEPFEVEEEEFKKWYEIKYKEGQWEFDKAAQIFKCSECGARMTDTRESVSFCWKCGMPMKKEML